MIGSNKEESSARLIADADFRLDFSGAITALSLLKLTRVFREMKSRQTLEVAGMDADAHSDVLRLLPAASYEVIAVDERDEASIRVRLRKI